MVSHRGIFYAALTVGALTAGAASATTTFVFDQTAADANSVSFTENGTTVDVTAAQCDPFSVFGAVGCVGAPIVQVTQEAEGLGVDGAFDNDSDIDSLPGNEFLVFTFDSVVQLSSISFGDLNQPGDDNDEYELYIDFGAGLTEVVGMGTDNPYEFGPGVFTDNLVVGAVNSDLLVDFRDGFKVASISIVPLPGAGLLMLAGFGGLAALRRRKSAA